MGSLAQLLEAARARITRLEPHEAFAAAGEGACLIDIRSDFDRERDGIVPGSLHIPRTVLEWRVDPSSPWRSDHLDPTAQTVIVLCEHGYSSSLAAAMLVELGVARVGDVVGGYEAWVAAGLPTARAPAREPEGLPGTGPPD